MGRTLRNKKGLVTNFAGAELFTRLEQAKPGRAFEFNGTDQFATIPAWTPRGLPFEVEVNAVPLSWTVNQEAIGSTPPNFRIYSPSFDVRLDTRYEDTSGSLGNTVVTYGSSIVGNRLSYVAKATPPNIAVTTNDSSQTPYGPPNPLAATFGGIAGQPSGGGVLWHGPIWDVKLTDYSPIQNTTVCYGDGVRYVQLQQPIVLEGDFEIEFDYIRNHTSNTWVLGNSTGDDQNGSLLVYHPGAGVPDALQLGRGGTSGQVANAFANVAQGQHCRVKVVVTGTALEAFIDGASVGTGSVGAGDGTGASFDYFANSAGSPNPIKSGEALQNIRIRDLTRDLSWAYNLTPAGTEFDIGDSKHMIAPGTIAANWGYLCDTSGAMTPAQLGGVNILDAQSFGENWFRINLDNGGQPLPDQPSIQVRFPTLFNDPGDKLWFDLFDLSGSGYSYGGTVPNIRKLLSLAEANSELVELRTSVKGLNWTTLDAPNVDQSTQGNYDNLPMYDTTVLEGDGVRYVQIPEFTLPASDDWRISVDWVRKDISGTLIAELLGLDSGSPTCALGVNDSTHATTPNRVRLDATGFMTWDNAMEGVAQGQHVNIVITRIGGAAELFVDGVSKGAGAGTINNDLVVDVLYRARSTQASRTLVSAMQAVTLHNLTTGEYVQYRIDEGEGTNVKAYDENGNHVFMLDGTVTPDAEWRYIPEYSNDGQWAPDTDWQAIGENNRHYPMNEGSGSVIHNILDESGATDGAIVGNTDDSGWTELDK